MLRDFYKYHYCECIGHTIDGDISLKSCICKDYCNKFCKKRNYRKIYNSNVDDIEIIKFREYKKERDNLRKEYFKEVNKNYKRNKKRININKFFKITTDYTNKLYKLQKKYFDYSEVKIFENF